MLAHLTGKNVSEDKLSAVREWVDFVGRSKEDMEPMGAWVNSLQVALAGAQHDVRGGISRCHMKPASAREAQSVRLLSRKQQQRVRRTWVMRYACGVVALRSCSAAMAQR